MKTSEQSKHTPGPWHVGRTITGKEEAIELSGITGDGEKKYDCFVVAPAYTVAGVGGIGKEECRANARLITSAPELLEACEAVLRLDYFQEHNALANQVRSAIRKAKGEVKV